MNVTETASHRPAMKVPAAWLLPVVAMFIGGSVGDAHEMVGQTALLVLGLGVFAGVSWQLLSRRDLTDRLTFFACCLLAGGAFLALAPSGYLLANSGPGHALAGTLAGLVLTERWMRRRSRSQTSTRRLGLS